MIQPTMGGEGEPVKKVVSVSFWKAKSMPDVSKQHALP